MSNTICIKHGNGNPSGKINPYELGFSDDEKKIYIGLSSDKALPMPLLISPSGKIFTLKVDDNGNISAESFQI